MSFIRENSTIYSKEKIEKGNLFQHEVPGFPNLWHKLKNMQCKQ